MSTFWLVCSASKSSSRKGHLVKIAENYELLAQRAKHRSKGPNANEGAAPSLAPIDWVARVQRPPIQPDIGTRLPARKAVWFHLIGVRLGNETEMYESGDEVQVVALVSA